LIQAMLEGKDWKTRCVTIAAVTQIAKVLV
jgi:hypothetical protein